MTQSDDDQRRMLWIDGVGGFLITPGAEWTIGGSAADQSPEVIKVIGAIPSRAARIRRQGSDYILEPLAETKLSDVPTGRPTLLRDDDTIELGGTVAIAFHRPHPLSASARLRPSGRHRFDPRADAVILLADSCVIGPSTGAHIRCPQWPVDVVLTADKGSWQVRAPQPISLDGREVGKRGTIDGRCRIESEGISFSIEFP